MPIVQGGVLLGITREGRAVSLAQAQHKIIDAIATLVRISLSPPHPHRFVRCTNFRRMAREKRSSNK
jgi:hypothetical protein